MQKKSAVTWQDINRALRWHIAREQTVQAEQRTGCENQMMRRLWGPYHSNSRYFLRIWKCAWAVKPSLPIGLDSMEMIIMFVQWQRRRQNNSYLQAICMWHVNIRSSWLRSWFRVHWGTFTSFFKQLWYAIHNSRNAPWARLWIHSSQP